VISLALGIGANTTIFTLINAFFLNPLQVERPQDLVAVFTTDENNTGVFLNSDMLPVSFPNFEDYRDQNEVFTDAACYSFPFPQSVSLRGEEAEQRFTEIIHHRYFDLLGVRMQVGRDFLPEEDATPGAHPVAIISDGLWKREFAASPTVVGQVIKINGLGYTVVGVAPEGFRGLNALVGPDLWVPTMMHAQILPAQFKDFFDDRRALFFFVAARLRPGVTREQAEANLKTIAGRLEREYPEVNDGRSAALMPLTEATIFPGIRQILLMGGLLLMTVVGLVLLIACSNVANLLLARAAARRKEIAIRISLGAGRGRLVQQLLTEAVVLGLMGGVAGLLVARWGRDFIWSFRPTFLPRNFLDLSLDARVLLFTLVISVLTGVLFGLVPALQISRPNLVGDLKEETVVAGRSRRLPSLRNVLVVTQVTLSIVTLVAAGLFLRSLGSAQDIDPGFDTERLSVITMNPGQRGYDQAQAEQFYEQLEERVGGLPGVRKVSLASNLPLFGGFARSVFLEGQDTRDQRKGVLVQTNTVDLDYFDTAGISFKKGRDFTAMDKEGAVEVVVINETMAEQFWPKQEALGRRLRFYGDEGFYREVVGIVETSNYVTLGEDPRACAFLPLRQNYSDVMNLYVASLGEPGPALSAAHREIRTLDPEMPTPNVWTISQAIDQSLWAVKLGAGLLAVMGLLALALAAVGLYGVMGYWVSQNGREIGIRMAIGARQPDVLKMVLLRGMMLVAVGLTLGVALSLGVSRLIKSILYASATDPVTFVGVPLLLSMVALVASFIPAYRASRVDPLIALRQL
jgi:predicted permease